jgi:L-ascorbate metabolism protein UlaG (beta-lactamase superfamily)
MLPVNDHVYLRSSIQLEPLVDQWYAWSHLIPPATAARNLTERHLKIMTSYITAPDVHAAAVRNPKMLGGPFIDYGGERVKDIITLREDTTRKRKRALDLSRAIDDLDGLLRTEAKGFSLQPLYSRVPSALRGFVELNYDLNNHPSFRLLEPLLYKSPFYEKDAQTIMLSEISGDDRPFVLSTPRLEDEKRLHIRVAFDKPGIDELFRMKTTPAPIRSIAASLCIEEPFVSLFSSFFTTQSPPPYQPYTGRGIRWRYFGHACILLETAGISILLDPVLSYTYESTLARYTYDDLPACIDCALITHNHQDHVLLETLLQLRHKTQTIIVPRNNGGSLQDPSLKLILDNCGFTGATEMAECQSLTLEGLSITALPFLGEHADLDIRSKLGYLITTARHKVLILADSCNIEPALYEHLAAEIGAVDVLFIGMECDGAPLSWLYGPLLTKRLDRSMDESRRLAGSRFDQAIDIVDRFRCREVYVYAMGQEPWLNHVMSIKYTSQSRPILESDRLIAECQSRGIIAERLYGEKEILIE